MNSPKKPSLAMRLAAVMQMRGIDGLPRNYELVYEAFSGADPDLVKAFKALGTNASQAALDEVGRKFLPHHFEATALEGHSSRVKDEMTAFLALLQEEQSSLTEYNAIVGSALKSISDEGTSDRLAVNQSMAALDEATRRRQERTETISRQVQQQTLAIQAVTTEVSSAEMQKFTDALTGLGNRRGFNRDLASHFKSERIPVPFGISMIDLDGFEKFMEKKLIGNDFIKVMAATLKSPVQHRADIYRFEGCKFAVIYQDATRDDVTDFSRRLQDTIRQNKMLRGVSISIGNCMSTDASDGMDIVSLADKSLREAQSTGGDKMVFHTPHSYAGQHKNFAIYEASHYE